MSSDESIYDINTKYPKPEYIKFYEENNNSFPSCWTCRFFTSTSGECDLFQSIVPQYFVENLDTKRKCQYWENIPF